MLFWYCRSVLLLVSFFILAVAVRAVESSTGTDRDRMNHPGLWRIVDVARWVSGIDDVPQLHGRGLLAV